MIVKVNDITNLTNTSSGSFLAGLNNTTGAGTSILAAGASLMIHRDAVDTAGHNLGVAVGTANAGRIFDTVDRAAGQTLFIVAANQFSPSTDDDNSYLWINPSSATFDTNNVPAPTSPTPAQPRSAPLQTSPSTSSPASSSATTASNRIRSRLMSFASIPPGPVSPALYPSRAARRCSFRQD